MPLTPRRSLGSLYRRARTFLFPYRRLADERFFQALQVANPGMMDPGNVFLFDHAIRHLPSADPLLEIGSFCGLSANLITFLKRNRPLSPCSLLTCVWAILVGPGQGHERSGTDGEKEDRAGGGEAVLA